MPENEFKRNVELDAQMVMVSMKGGMDGLLNWGLLNRHIFETPDKCVQRANWLKEQDDGYIMSVSERVATLEQEAKNS